MGSLYDNDFSQICQCMTQQFIETTIYHSHLFFSYSHVTKNSFSPIAAADSEDLQSNTRNPLEFLLKKAKLKFFENLFIFFFM